MKQILLVPLLILSLANCKSTSGSGSQAKGEPMIAPGGPAETSMILAYMGHLDKKTDTDFRIWEDPANAGKVLAAVKRPSDSDYINLFPLDVSPITGTYIMTSDVGGDYKKAALIVLAGYQKGDDLSSAWATTLKLRQFTGTFTAEVNSDSTPKDRAIYSFTFDIFGDVGGIFSSVPKADLADTAFAADEKLWLGYESPRCSCPAGFHYRQSGADGGELSIYVDSDGSDAGDPFGIFYFAGAGMNSKGESILKKYGEKPANLSSEEEGLTITNLKFSKAN